MIYSPKQLKNETTIQNLNGKTYVTFEITKCFETQKNKKQYAYLYDCCWLINNDLYWEIIDRLYQIELCAEQEVVKKRITTLVKDIRESL